MYIKQNMMPLHELHTSRMPSIVSEQERVNCNNQKLILNDSLAWFGWKILELPRAGLEPVTFCVLGRRCTS